MSDTRALHIDPGAGIVHSVDDPRLVDAMEENAAYALADIAVSLGGERYHGPDMSRYISGVPIHFLNGVISARLPADRLDDAIEQAMEPFKARSMPMQWMVGPTSRPDSLGERLEAHGLIHGGETPCMAVDISAVPPPSPLPSVAFVEVSNEAHVEQFSRAAAIGFEYGAEAIPLFQEITARACLPPNPQWVYHLGLLAGQPVATCTTFLHAGVAGLYTICTVPEARGRGIGGAITQLAVQHASTLGYRVSTLQATRMGFPVYRSLGYETCAVFHEYEWTPPHFGESSPLS